MRPSDAAAGAFRGRRPRLAIGLVTVVVFATFTATATTSRQGTAGEGFKVVGTWGGNGTAPGKFDTTALGLATDKDGTVYVADSRIQSFSAKGAFKQLFAFTAGGTVSDVAVGPDGDVWGTTQVGAQVRRFPKGGGAPEDFATPKSAEGIGIDAEGSLYVSIMGDEIVGAVVRFDRKPTGWEPAKTWVGSGFQAPGDVEVSPDGSIYVADRRGAPPNVKRFDSTGKLLNTIKLQMPATAGAGAQFGLAVDLDCNLWATNPQERNMARYSPAGKLLGTATSGDLVGTDVAVGPTGDLYVWDVYTQSVIHLVEDRSKPAAAAVTGIAVQKKGAGYVARVKYTLAGVACPAQVDATASLAGKGIAGKARVKVGAGKATVIEIPLAKGALATVAGTTASATFKIVLKTNGRPTTQRSAVKVSVPASAR